MKKIGMIVLALVITLGTIGVGYAMWSDEVVIEGTVYTGSLDLNVEYYSGSRAFKNYDETLETPIVMYYYVYAANGTIVNKIWNPHGTNVWDPPTGASNLTAIAGATSYATAVDDVVQMTFYNVFPTVYQGGATGIYADVIVHYEGTIPAHIGWTANFSGNEKLEWLYANGYIDIYCFRTTISPHPVLDPPYINYSIGELIRPEQVIQVHNSNRLKLNVYVSLPQCDDTQMIKDGYTCEDFMGLGTEAAPLSFTLKILAEQWNESQWQ